MEHMGKQIRLYRLRSSMTQEKLAEALQVSPQAVSKWETGAGYPDVALLPELAAVLGTTIDELFETDSRMELRRIERMLDNEIELKPELYDRAEQSLREISLDGETRGAALTLLAELNNHRAQSLHRRAAEYAKQALLAEPEKKDNHSALTEAMHGCVWDWCCSNHTELIDYYKAFVAKHPKYFPGYLWLMDNLIADLRLDESSQTLEQMRSVKDSYHYLLYKGWIADAAGDRAQAEAIWDEMVAQDEANWHVHSSRADAYAKHGAYQKAIKAYQRAAELEEAPRYIDNWESIGQICKLTGDYRGAIAAYEKVLEILRQDWKYTEGEMVQEFIRTIQNLEELSRDRP